MTDLVTVATPTVTKEQLALVTSTIAKDATPAELQLFLYDCARQGVHPLDKLIHFTKRSGKYTPITSIDFMRIRAADSGEYAGNDDALFTGTPKGKDFAATAVVYRLNKGQRFPFSATARWVEYVPDQAFMWNKMPHVMLAKCAEALALRKAFPKQLAGLYAKEEFEQGDPPALARSDRALNPEPAMGAAAAPAANLNELIPESWREFVKPELEGEYVRGVVAMVDEEKKTSAKSGREYTKTNLTMASGEILSTLDRDIASVARDCFVRGTAVEIKTKPTRWGKDVISIARVPEEGDDVPL